MVPISERKEEVGRRTRRSGGSGEQKAKPQVNVRTILAETMHLS